MAIDPSAEPQALSRDELVVAARDGSEQALDVLLETARTYLLIAGRRRMSRELQVKVAPSDLVQQTLAQAHRVLGSFEGQTHRQFTAWLLGILRHKLLHARRSYRAQRRDLRREEPVPDRSSLCHAVERLVDEETPSRVAIRAEDAATLRAALSRLPRHYQQVIRLRNFELLCFDEVGTVMNRPAGAARALWGRAIVTLRRELRADEAC